MAQKKSAAQGPRRQIVASNRKARHDYSIIDVFEAGIVLTGTEVKSLRDGKASLVNTVTLEVTPEQAETLKLAETSGRLQLSIRNGIDQIIEKTRGKTRRDVLNDIALEYRSREGTRDNFGSGPRPSATPPTWYPVRP